MSDNLNFKSFLAAANEAAEPELAPMVEQPVAQEEVVVAEQTEVEPSTPARPTLEDRMRAKGFEIPEDIDPVDFYDQAIERIAAGTQALQAKQEAEALRQELERLRNQPVPSAAPTPPVSIPQPETTETHEERAQRLFMELQEYDPTLTTYVERDESGRAVPKAAYGQAAIEAAKVINDYEAAERRQAQLLLRNPKALIDDSRSVIERLAEEKAKAIVDSRFASWQEEQQRAREEQAQAARAAQEAQALQAFHEANKAKLFPLDAEGNPLRMPFDQDQFSYTPTGRYFMQRLNELRNDMPGVPQITLLNLAMREAELAVPPVQKAAVVETATPAEKRQAFVEQRNDAAVLPHQNTPPASGPERVSGATRFRFSDLARRMPENHDYVNSWSN